MKKHLKKSNLIKITNEKKELVLSLEKSLKPFNNEIKLNIAFENRADKIPENIKYTIVYKEPKTLEELDKNGILEDIHSDVWKYGYWTFSFKKNVGNLIADKLIITPSPYLSCEFWLRIDDLSL